MQTLPPHLNGCSVFLKSDGKRVTDSDAKLLKRSHANSSRRDWGARVACMLLAGAVPGVLARVARASCIWTVDVSCLKKVRLDS